MADAPPIAASEHVLSRISLGRPRLLAAVLVAIAAYVLLPYSGPTRALLAWNVGTWLYIALALMMILGSDTKTIRWRAARTDDAKWIFLILVVLAAATALAAILGEIGIAKDTKGTLKGLHLSLAAITLVSAWIFIHLTFALHYAHEYFDAHKSEEGEKLQLRGGLNFPNTEEPDYWDFLYFSFIIGVASQTADVSITSKAMRRTSLGHSVLSFFFNSAILALTINIAAGLI